MAELKPCPFCGAECDIAFNDNRVVSARELIYAPFCKNVECFMNMNNVGFYTKEEAIEAWNRRAGDGN